MKIKTLFIGTSEFATPTLETLMKLDYIELTGVVTQPDKPIGRHQEILFSPVKQKLLSLSKDIPIYQPEKIKEYSSEILDSTKPELIIVASYGQMIPDEILNYPKFKCLNLHGSLLPLLRGAIPIQMAIMKGFKKTGVTLQIMVKKMDEGDIIATKEMTINSDDTTTTLTQKLAYLSTKLIEQDLPLWLRNKIKPVAQNNKLATYCYKSDITKEKAMINWNEKLEIIERKTRAYDPWPIAWTILGDIQTSQEKRPFTLLADPNLKNKKLQIFRTKIVKKEELGYEQPKLYKHQQNLYLRSKFGWMEILECKLEGKKKMEGKNYLFLAQDTTVRVRGILIFKNQILLIYRKRMGQEYYALPGGAVGVSESNEKALIREFKEETEIDIKVEDFLYEEPSSDNITRHLVYKCIISNFQQPKMSGEELIFQNKNNVYKPKWIDLNKIEQLNINNEIKNYIKNFV